MELHLVRVKALPWVLYGKYEAGGREVNKARGKEQGNAFTVVKNFEVFV